MVGEGVQIINESNTHWLCVSTIGCKPDKVSIYNSKLRKIKVHSHATKQIASLRRTKSPQLKLRVMHSQGQSGGADCDLFAIEHLIDCLENGKMVSFPARDLSQRQEAIQTIEDELVLATVNTRIYCSCRMPQAGNDKMAQCTSCDEWFHQRCENIHCTQEQTTF